MITITIATWYYDRPFECFDNIYGGKLFKCQDKIINVDNISWMTKEPQTLETWEIIKEPPTGWFKGYKSPTIRKGDTIKHGGFKYLNMNCGTRFLVKAEDLDKELSRLNFDTKVVIKHD